MRRSLDFFDLKILEGLGSYGPRNILAVARKLGVPEATLRRRLQQMLSQVFLQSNVYHTNIGLKKVIVFAKAIQGYENLLYKCLDAHDYVIYISRSYGAFEGCFAIFAIPVERCPDFERFLEYLKNQGVAERIQHHWSTCFQTVNLKCDWYDEHSESWGFFWNDWIQEVLTGGTELPFTLKDPPEYPLKGDKWDIFILKELELDATVSLKAIATKLKTSVPLIKYHYDKHVVGRCLLEGFQIIYYPFDRSRSNGFFFMFMFDNLENMSKFARSLLDKPFARSLGKIFGEPSLFAHIYLPLSEFRSFVDSLGELIRRGFLQKYEYAIQDMKITQRYTIPYKSFKNESWIYEQEEYLKKVDTLVNAEKQSLTKIIKRQTAYLPKKIMLH
jgi:DNA-binding Lrp family transcriptional regulator